MEQGSSVRFAPTLVSRMVGLLRKKVCAQGEVLVLLPCKSIHTLGMRESIDVAFVDVQGVVLKSMRALPPWRFASCRHAVCVLERRSDEEKPWFEASDVVELLL